MLGTPIRCRVNAALGGPDEYIIPPAKVKKKVVVIGGGPAGMEAARVAAVRGHNVTLYDKASKLGGLLPYYAAVKGDEVDNDATCLVGYWTAQLSKEGVKVKLGEEFTPAKIASVKPDAVILAVGGVPVTPDIPGIKGKNVLSLEDLRIKLQAFIGPRGASKKITSQTLDPFIGKKVIIIGGSIEAFTLAAFLIERGRDVTIVADDNIMRVERGIADDFLMMQMSYRYEKRPAILKEVKYGEITDKGMTITTKEGQKQTLAADTIFLALPPNPNKELLNAFKAKMTAVYMATGTNEKGLDCIMDAINSGYWVAKAI
jgi:2,4-dienoyl-CoA reductase (NADPH2)